MAVEYQAFLAREEARQQKNAVGAGQEPASAKPSGAAGGAGSVGAGSVSDPILNAFQKMNVTSKSDASAKTTDKTAAASSTSAGAASASTSPSAASASAASASHPSSATAAGVPTSGATISSATPEGAPKLSRFQERTKLIDEVNTPEVMALRNELSDLRDKIRYFLIWEKTTGAILAQAAKEIAASEIELDKLQSVSKKVPKDPAAVLEAIRNKEITAEDWAASLKISGLKFKIQISKESMSKYPKPSIPVEAAEPIKARIAVLEAALEPIDEKIEAIREQFSFRSTTAASDAGMSSKESAAGAGVGAGAAAKADVDKNLPRTEFNRDLKTKKF